MGFAEPGLMIIVRDKINTIKKSLRKQNIAERKKRRELRRKKCNYSSVSLLVLAVVMVIIVKCVLSNSRGVAKNFPRGQPRTEKMILGST